MNANANALRGLWYLTVLTFRRQLRSRKTAVALAFLLLLAGLVFILGRLGPWTHQSFGVFIALGVFVTFFIPVVGVAYGTGALGDDRDEKSVIHLLARGLPRSGIALAKFLAVAPLALAITLGGIWILIELANLGSQEGIRHFFGAFWQSVLLSTLAYLALFHLFTVLFRHSTAIAVAYAFFVEVFIGSMPGILKRVSIQFYAKSLALERASPLDLGRLFGPIPGSAARVVLVAMIAVLLIASALAFGRGRVET